ncbi:hypothetical protein O9992_15300 [Vibrio lentus]|nr:hypothetical protein [Vibrio lentus]
MYYLIPSRLGKMKSNADELKMNKGKGCSSNAQPVIALLHQEYVMPWAALGLCSKRIIPYVLLGAAISGFRGLPAWEDSVEKYVGGDSFQSIVVWLH